MSDQSRKPTWREMFEAAVKEASEDPEAFVEDAKVIAKHVGKKANEVYVKVKDDPNFPRRLAMNKLIQEGAQRLRRKMGF